MAFIVLKIKMIRVVFRSIQYGLSIHISNCILDDELLVFYI